MLQGVARKIASGARRPRGVGGGSKGFLQTLKEPGPAGEILRCLDVEVQES